MPRYKFVGTRQVAVVYIQVSRTGANRYSMRINI